MSRIAARVAYRFLQARGEKLDPRSRKAINKDLRRAGFDGNGRFRSIGHALDVLYGELRKHGLETGDIFTAYRKPSGHETLPLSVTDPDNPFYPSPVGNSVVVFQWTELTEGRFEIIAYLS